MRFPLVVLMLPIFIDCAQPPEQVITSTWPDGSAKREVTIDHHYYQDNQVGLYRTWHPNGQLFMEGSYSEQGNPTGTWTFKDDQGNTIRSLEGETLNP